ncbi:MAG: ABC transporter substrate-binding protein [Candidatus Limnocylindrales bacterium]
MSSFGLAAIHRHHAVPVAITLGIVITLAACTEAGSSSAPTIRPSAVAAPSQTAAPQNVDAIKIGWPLELTGSLSATGEGYRSGGDLAAEEINARGGIAKWGGATLELVYADAQSKPEVASGELQRLIEQEGVIGVIGPVGSSNAIPSSQVAERLQTPYLNLSASAETFVERGLTWIYSQTVTSKEYGYAYVDVMDDLAKRKGLDTSSVVLVWEDQDMGTGMSERVRERIEEKGYQLSADISYPRTQPDLTSIAARVKEARPTVIINPAYLGDFVVLRRALDQLDVNVQMIGPATSYSHPSLPEKLGALADGLIGLAQWSADSPQGKSVAERYAQKYGRPMNVDAAIGYQGVMTYALALELADVLTPTGLANGLQALDVPPGEDLVLAHSGIRFVQVDNGSWRNAAAGLLATQYQDGALVTIWPSDYATTEPVVATGE